MIQKESLMVFPCDFEIKIIGKNTDSFLSDITMIVRKYFPKLKGKAIRSHPSKQNNYLSISITLPVKDQITLDKLYCELTKHPAIKMVL